MIAAISARLLIAALGLLALAACAPVDKGSWWRPNVTVDEFNKDDYECVKDNLATSYQSTRLFPGTVITAPRAAVNEELYDRCMMARGYRIVPRDFAPPAAPSSSPPPSGGAAPTTDSPPPIPRLTPPPCPDGYWDSTVGRCLKIGH